VLVYALYVPCARVLMQRLFSFVPLCVGQNTWFKQRWYCPNQNRGCPEYYVSLSSSAKAAHKLECAFEGKPVLLSEAQLDALRKKLQTEADARALAFEERERAAAQRKAAIAAAAGAGATTRGDEDDEDDEEENDGNEEEGGTPVLSPSMFVRSKSSKSSSQNIKARAAAAITEDDEDGLDDLEEGEEEEKEDEKESEDSDSDSDSDSSDDDEQEQGAHVHDDINCCASSMASWRHRPLLRRRPTLLPLSRAAVEAGVRCAPEQEAQVRFVFAWGASVGSPTPSVSPSRGDDDGIHSCVSAARTGSGGELATATTTDVAAHGLQFRRRLFVFLEPVVHFLLVFLVVHVYVFFRRPFAALRRVGVGVVDVAGHHAAVGVLQPEHGTWTHGRAAGAGNDDEHSSSSRGARA
jgi:hypothetical protein